MRQNASPTLEENISAFVCRIRSSSNCECIEYLHGKCFKLHCKIFVKMQEFDDFADFFDQNGQLDLFKSWFHSNFLLGMDVDVRQSAFQVKGFVKAILFTLHMQILKSHDSFYCSFLPNFCSEGAKLPRNVSL